MSESYPLHWPQGWPRTKHPERSRFKVTPDVARRELQSEVKLLGGRYLVLSTNIELRLDGNPYAGRRDPTDVGVAVYFEFNGKSMTFACDRWDRLYDNVRAIGNTISAMRGIERWGASDLMERAFSAFEALPAPKKWHEILGVSKIASRDEVKAAYHILARVRHPDRGGSHEAMTELTGARDNALKEILA